MEFKPFQETDLPALHRAFSEAFATYSVPFQLSFDAFRKRILNKLRIDSDLSYMAYRKDRCVGFVLHTKEEYEGKLTIYNGGTGVIPEFRGNQLTEQLYESLTPQIKESGAKIILLEVITTNAGAIKVYERLGFQYRQTFKCYKRKPSDEVVEEKRNQNLRIIRQMNWHPVQYRSCYEFEPSFIDSFPHLLHNRAHEICLEAYEGDSFGGFVIFQPHVGRISQLAVTKESRGKGIATSLLSHAAELSLGKELTFINIPEEQEQMHEFLLARGFENQVDQYEMELVI